MGIPMDWEDLDDLMAAEINLGHQKLYDDEYAAFFKQYCDERRRILRSFAQDFYGFIDKSLSPDAHLGRKPDDLDDFSI